MIFWLFVALAVGTAFTLTLFAATVEPQFRGRVYVALGADLMAPILAWFLLKGIGRRRLRKSH